MSRSKKNPLHKKDKHVTKLAHRMPNTTIIEYEDIDDLKNKLEKALDELKK